MSPGYQRSIGLSAGVFLFFLFCSCNFTSDVLKSITAKPTEIQENKLPKKDYETPLPAFNPMQFTWFYKPPENSGDIPVIADNFSLIILTRNDENKREALRNAGYQGPVLQYLRFEAVMDAGDCQTKPFQNQAANLEGDFCQISNLHPDWFLTDSNNMPVKLSKTGYLVMDPGSVGWQNFFLDRVTGFQKDAGWAGLFLDNVDASLGRFESMEIQTAKYPDDGSYQIEIEKQLAELSHALHQNQNKQLIANITYLKSPETWFRYLVHLDGAMMEAFAADWRSGYLSESDWLEQIAIAEETQSQGKTILLVTQGEMDDRERMVFSLASFLLVNNGKAFFRYTNDQDYRQIWWYPEFGLDLGQPFGPRYKISDQWQRDFENGSVIVNPVSHAAEIIMN